ncbi:hypothetical protein N658DRAFT_287488 [Parathielavia hyrcaniae]|uniref:Secreted protein n=1 Tax=Parathielavia hyrcaniae TaxID=113614 RepID=A0AAN6PUW1_9PEZI|nr:hypothetical protein N658DRAFT_287488 [Parathielavia hyrcaniae]
MHLLAGIRCFISLFTIPPLDSSVPGPSLIRGRFSCLHSSTLTPGGDARCGGVGCCGKNEGCNRQTGQGTGQMMRRGCIALGSWKELMLLLAFLVSCTHHGFCGESGSEEGWGLLLDSCPRRVGCRCRCVLVCGCLFDYAASLTSCVC